MTSPPSHRSPVAGPTTAAARPHAAKVNTYVIAGQTLQAQRPPPGLYVVATPIGNLGDVTLRALEVLAGADLIACEDTRTTHRLLDRFGITTPTTPYHDHNAAAVRPRLIAQIKSGASVALVSDAGTPLISDPGFKLVREAQDEAIALTALPGASSVLTALCVAGLPTDRFFFDGFLPPKQGARRNRIVELARIDATLVLFEGGSRMAETMRDLSDILGQRPAAICRELTKLHEEVQRDVLGAFAARTDADWETRGEFVIVIGPPSGDNVSDADIDRHLAAALTAHSLKDAVAAVVALTGRPRRDIYARALELSGQSHDRR